MNGEILFTEKQYLGREPINQSIRLLIALVCFAIYYISDGEDAARILPIVGFAIIIVSVVLMFMLHYSTKVTPTSIILDGLWTSRRIKIDFLSISSVEVITYSSYLISNPVYNLHRKGIIRFYACGKKAVKLSDKTGLIYIIGTQHANELSQIIKKQIHA